MTSKVEDRLNFYMIGDAERKTVAANQDKVGKRLGPALDVFYQQVMTREETARYFRDAGHRNQAKGAQHKHWERLLTARFDSDYIESNLRIGKRHAVLNLDPKWYFGAYAVVLGEMVAGLQNGSFSIPGLKNDKSLIPALIKFALLDMDMTITTINEIANEARNQAIAELTIGLRALAEGNLGYEIKEIPAEFKELKEAFNDAASRMRESIGGVRQSADTIRTGAHEISAASEDLARRTESSAASLQETSTALSSMNERLNNTVESARQSLKGADGAIRAVEGGRGVARDAMQAMEGVSESAEGIDQVIEGLDKIAFQTRVLAMNAAVEAGRAGEAGRGFAVVADLVSALAMRAEEQAKHARDQLTSTQTDIHSAVEAVKRVSSSLDSIHEASDKARSLAQSIADDSTEQAATIGEINSAISSMDMTVQQNAAMVEQSSAATRSLLTEIDAMAESTSRFQLGHAANDKAAAPKGPKGFVPQDSMKEFG